MIAAPFTDVTRKGALDKINWTAECEKEYSTLKGKLTAKSILRLLDLYRQFT